MGSCEDVCLGDLSRDATGACVCSGDFVPSFAGSTTCIADVTDCTSPQTYSEELETCVCPAGFDIVGDSCEAECTGDLVRDSSDMCACPAGSTMDDMDTSACNTDCSAG